MKIGDKIQFTQSLTNVWRETVFKKGDIATITRLIPLMADDRFVPPDAEFEVMT